MLNLIECVAHMEANDFFVVFKRKKGITAGNKILSEAGAAAELEQSLHLVAKILLFFPNNMRV